MVRAPYFDKNGLKKGAWSKEEDDKLKAYIWKHGHWNWRQLPKFAGLQRCGKSCRIRWLNYLRPDVKRGGYTKEEEDLISQIYDKLGSKWSKIAEHLPGRTDNEIKNYWHTHLKKRGNYKQQQITATQQEMEKQTIGSSQKIVVIKGVAVVEKEESSNVLALKKNPSKPIRILESSPLSSSTAASSSTSAAFDGSESDGDDLVISLKEPAWSEEEDEKLRAYIQGHDLVSTLWSDVPRLAGLSRSYTSSCLRWMSHLRPHVLKHADYTTEDADVIKVHEQLGKLRSTTVAQLPGTTYEETENHCDIANAEKLIELINHQQPSDFPNLLAYPILDDNSLQILKVPEYSPHETFLLYSDLDTVDATAPMDWIVDDTYWNSFEIFEADFWTRSFVLDSNTCAARYA